MLLEQKFPELSKNFSNISLDIDREYYQWYYQGILSVYQAGFQDEEGFIPILHTVAVVYDFVIM